jgi:hypothetical protein
MTIPKAYYLAAQAAKWQSRDFLYNPERKMVAQAAFSQKFFKAV